MRPRSPKLVACQARFAVAVDTEPRYCDVAEATKVRLDGRRVVELGRGLERFDAVDAGMFVCDTDLLQVAERSLADGGGSWNAVRRRCIAEGHEVEAVDLQGAFWIDVDTAREARRAERLLVERAATKRADGPVARHLNRRLSRPLSLLLVRLGVSPTAVTVASFLLTLAAAGALALGSLWPLALIAGGVLVQLASVSDGVDGEIARASLRASPYGGFLDSVLDRAGDAAVLVGLAVAAGLDTASYAAVRGRALRHAPGAVHTGELRGGIRAPAPGLALSPRRRPRRTPPPDRRLRRCASALPRPRGHGRAREPRGGAALRRRLAGPRVLGRGRRVAAQIRARLHRIRSVRARGLIVSSKAGNCRVVLQTFPDRLYRFTGVRRLPQRMALVRSARVKPAPCRNSAPTNGRFDRPDDPDHPADRDPLADLKLLSSVRWPVAVPPRHVAARTGRQRWASAGERYGRGQQREPRCRRSDSRRGRPGSGYPAS